MKNKCSLGQLQGRIAIVKTTSIKSQHSLIVFRVDCGLVGFQASLQNFHLEGLDLFLSFPSREDMSSQITFSTVYSSFSIFTLRAFCYISLGCISLISNITPGFFLDGIKTKGPIFLNNDTPGLHSWSHVSESYPMKLTRKLFVSVH